MTTTPQPQSTDANADAKTTDGKPMNDLLIAVAENQDKEAFQQLYVHFAPRLKSFLMRQGTDMQMAEEVVQEAMVKVWRKASQFDPSKASASTWIFTIGRNLRVDMLRKALRPELDHNDPALVPGPELLASEAVSKKQDAKRLATAVTKLPDEQQQILKLAFFEEKAHRQIAEELGIPLGTVKSRIRLAFKRLRSELGEFE